MAINIQQPAYPPITGSPDYRQLSQVTSFIIHHEAGPWDETPLQVDAQHRSQGWVMIGYTWVIGKDGTIYQGRPMNMVPAAAQDMNTVSVDVSLTGNFEPSAQGYCGSPTAAQIQSLKELCLWAHQQIPSISQTIGHRDVATIMNDPSVATACPGDTLYALIPDVRSYVAENLGK